MNINRATQPWEPDSGVGQWGGPMFQKAPELKHVYFLLLLLLYFSAVRLLIMMPIMMLTLMSNMFLLE